MIFDLDGKSGVQPEFADPPQHEVLPPRLETVSCGDVDGKPMLPDVAEANDAPFVALSSRHTSGSSGSTQTSSEYMRERLLLAKRQAHLRELRLRVPTVAGATVLGLFTLLLLAISNRFSPLYVLATTSSVCSMYFGFLGLMPHDRRAVPIVITFIVIPIMLGVVLVMASNIRVYLRTVRDGDCMVDDDALPCWFIIVLLTSRCIEMLAHLLFIGRIGYAVKQRAPSQVLLSTLWSATGCMFLMVGSGSVPKGVAALVAGQISKSFVLFAAGAPQVIAGWLMLFALDFRRRLQSWFTSRGGAAVTAAGIAELLAGRRIDEVLDSARNTFHFVPADRVLRWDMEDNCPNPTLSGLTQKARLGLVDAFVSHSWHDDSDDKWDALQTLRNDFNAKHSREPKLWIDKYCINQNEITMSLACLPVYLSGCCQLWILCGSTYLQRLWCIMEILIFIEMGGHLKDLHVKLLGDFCDPMEQEGALGHSVNSCKSWVACLESFNPRSARCTTEHDTEKLQAVLEATGQDRIIDLVRKVFK